jgi:hypothetical protein
MGTQDAKIIGEREIRGKKEAGCVMTTLVIR